jgi:hypothetical protein
MANTCGFAAKQTTTTLGSEMSRMAALARWVLIGIAVALAWLVVHWAVAHLPGPPDRRMPPTFATPR